MDVQTLCLGVLALGESSGYEIKKYLEEFFGHFYKAGYGSIYPALSRLTEEGLVDCRSVPQNGRPDKKVYRLNASGREALTGALVRAEPRHQVKSEFLVQICLADHLPVWRLREILSQRLQAWQQVLAMIDESRAADPDCPPGMAFARGFGEAMAKAARDYVAAHQDELIAAVEATDGPSAAEG